MKVFLAGAGPGATDLITLRAANALSTADVVAYDRLIEPAMLELAAVKAELINVGKPLWSQHEINTLLIDKARRGLTVVRLKGGDPFVFGRGGEEAQALIKANIPFEIIPGISSAIAVPQADGIPVTHRGMSSAFTVISGHDVDGNFGTVNWQALAKVGSTIVVLMGVKHRGRIADELMLGGLAKHTPVSVICNGTTNKQVTLRTCLGELADADVRSPAVIVIGAVAALQLESVASLVEI